MDIMWTYRKGEFGTAGQKGRSKRAAMLLHTRQQGVRSHAGRWENASHLVGWGQGLHIRGQPRWGWRHHWWVQGTGEKWQAQNQQHTQTRARAHTHSQTFSNTDSTSPKCLYLAIYISLDGDLSISKTLYSLTFSSNNSLVFFSFGGLVK